MAHLGKTIGGYDAAGASVATWDAFIARSSISDPRPTRSITSRAPLSRLRNTVTL